MNSVNRIIAAALAALAVSAAGCRCDGGAVTNRPDYVAMPTALSFSACPKKDEMMRDVADVFPDEQKVTISNQGKAGGTFTAELTGTDAAQFKLDAMRTPSSIGASSSDELPVQFSPVKKGDARATLTIDDGDETTAKITVDLVGTGKNLPSQPTVDAAIESYASPGDFTQICKDGVPLSACQQAFPDTLLMDTSTLRIKLRNKGCPALKVTGIELEKSANGSPDAAFFLDQPSTLPSSSNPLVMSTADGTDELTLVIRFSPQSNADPTEQRYATLTITTNDPTTPTMVIALSGNGLQPAIYAVPSFCNFNDPNDRCRVTGVKVIDRAVFEINNGGGTPITITSAKFASSGVSTQGSNMRFKVMTPIDGTMLMPGAKAMLEVEHVNEPLFVIDQITVLASPASAGKVVLTVAGGTAPCLETDPGSILDFNMPTTEISVKPVTVKALAVRPGNMQPCGDLIVDAAEITANPFFSIVAPSLDAGTRIAAGSQGVFTVQYKKPVIGGKQAWDMTIKTNDLDYGAPSFKKLLVQSEAPLNQLPVCVLKGCTPAMTDCSTMGTTSMTVSLSQTFGGGAKNITLWGGDSYDPGNTGSMPIAQWKFAVIPPSPNVPGYMLPNNGMYTMMNSGVLTLDPAATGLYKVFLYVKDDSGQQSAQACELRIDVRQ